MQTATAPNEMDKLTSDADDIEEALRRSFDRSFERGINKKVVLSTFEAALGGLKKSTQAESRLRGISRAAALSTASKHGNIIQTGRYLLANIESYAVRYELNPGLAVNQILLGLAEATCQINPIVYGRFLEVAQEYKDDADEWICQNRRLPVELGPVSLEAPTIVPYEDELTLKPQAGTTSTADSDSPAEAAETPPPAEHEAAGNAPEKASESLVIPKKESTGKGWTSSGKKSIFRRLTEVMGSFFRR